MSYGNNAIYVHNPNQIPQVKHWAIVEGSSYTTEGDQRSRDAPGHGYPASTNYFIEYRAFLSEEDWKAEIDVLMKSSYRKSFRAMIVTPVTINVNISTEIVT